MIEFVAPAPAVINAAPFVEPLTPVHVRVGDTGFDNMSGFHCEVMRVGDRAYEGQVRGFFMPRRTRTFGRRAVGFAFLVFSLLAQ